MHGIDCYQRGPDGQCVCGDHHVHLADRLTGVGQLVSDVGVPVGSIRIPRHYPDNLQELMRPNANVQSRSGP